MESYYRKQVRIASKRLRVVLNGVDVERFHRTTAASSVRRLLGSPDSVLVGTAGRFFPVKRYDDLLRVAAQVCPIHPQVRFVMLGDGPERSRLERTAQELGVSDRVFFAGWQTDLSTWLSALDVFVLTSNSEGLPLGALEAMATGLPVVTTPVGDLPEVVADGRSGFLVPVGNVKAMAQAITRLVDDDSLRCRMGAQAREDVCKRYNQRSMVENYMELYRA